MVSGAVAEFIFEQSADISGELKIEIRGPDLSTAEILSKCFQFNLEEKISEVLTFLKLPEFWNAVEVLANVITESGERTITDEVIMANLEHSGFLKYLDQVAN